MSQKCECEIYQTCPVCRPQAGPPPFNRPPESSRELATFEVLAESTIARCQAIYRTRGEQYADTLKECQWATLSAVMRKMGIGAQGQQCLRAIAMAALVDVKYIRQLGGYSDDSLVDGINYAAVLAEDMRQIIEAP